MREYTFSDNGFSYREGVVEKRQHISKTVNTLSGDGEWKWLYGVRLFVDPSGIVIKGPDLFIGRSFEDLKNLNYHDVFTVERSIMRAMGLTNKSYNPDDPDYAKEKEAILNETKEWLDKTLKIRKEQALNAYVKDPLYTVKVE